MLFAMNGALYPYPVFLNIRDKKCVVVGGGSVGLRKASVLRECGASVTVVSPQVHNGTTGRETRGLTVTRRKFVPSDLDAAFLVVAATDSEEVNGKVALEARRRGALVNVVDVPEESDFIIPSVIRRGELTVAISTSGGSPALARKLRTCLENTIGEEFGVLLSVVKDVRSNLKHEGIHVDPEAWQKVLEIDPLVELIRLYGPKQAHEKLLEALLRYIEKHGDDETAIGV